MLLNKVRFLQQVAGPGPRGFQKNNFAAPQYRIVANGGEVSISEGEDTVVVWGVPYDGTVAPAVAPAEVSANPSTTTITLPDEPSASMIAEVREELARNKPKGSPFNVKKGR